MSTLLKDYFTPNFIKTVSEKSSILFDFFNAQKFESDVLNNDWNNYELKERYHHIAHCLREQFNSDYSKAVKELVLLSNSFKDNKLENTHDLVYMFLPAVIEDFGGDHFKDSVWAMEHVTQLISCEFAIRQFFIHHEREMLEIALNWTKHESKHLRRLASEGSRPALPWGKALNSFKKDPSAIFPILENLKNDDSLYVRKSVANNLNDISKTHPEEVIHIAKKWQGTSDNTNWIIKHACRTLLKQGNPEVFPLFGYLPPNGINLIEFNYPTSINMGEELNFSFNVKSSNSKTQKLRIEYAVYFIRKNNEHNHKVFMISEKEIKKGEELHFDKTYSFKPISTRKYYPGIHKLSIIINGIEQEKINFQLI